MRYCFIRFPGGKSKALTLSYDDGCIHDRKLIETLNRYNIKTTLNVNSGFMSQQGDGWHLTAEELGKLAESGGHEIAVHGAHHIAPGKASAVNGIADILDCRRDLERAYGKIIRGMAYPDSGITATTAGVSKKQIKSYIKSLGIVYSRSLGGDNDSFSIPEDWFEWMPTAHHINPMLMTYLEKFLNAEPRNNYIAHQNSLLFYLWGHSFEYENNKNWDLLEEFCKKAGNRDDIWYATNIEIYDYVEAFRSLRFSVDNDLVYNPSLFTVWFTEDSELFSIEPGQTLKIS